MSYLLLCSRIITTLVIQSKVHLPSHSFCGLRVHAWLSRVTCKAAVKVLARARFSFTIDWGKICVQAHVIVCSTQFLEALQTEKAFSFLLAISWKPPLVSCSVTSSSWWLTTWWLASSKPT